MWEKDGLLQELQKKTARKAHLKTILDDLRAQEHELSEMAAVLDTERKREGMDVERLQGRSLSAFFYTVTGKKDEHLEKERKEAYAASAKYDAVMRELCAVRADIKRYNAEYSALIGYDVQYEKLLCEKAIALKVEGSKAAEKIIEFETRISKTDNAKAEAKEAIAAGRRAKKSAETVLEKLNNAKGWASWDILGGGMIADMAKHDKLDAAQDAVEELQINLRRFKTELADITLEAEHQVNIDGFLRFADLFFDGIFVDYSILQRIEESKEKIEAVKCQIDSVIAHIKSDIAVWDKEKKAIKRELNALIAETPL